MEIEEEEDDAFSTNLVLFVENLPKNNVEPNIKANTNC